MILHLKSSWRLDPFCASSLAVDPPNQPPAHSSSHRFSTSQHQHALVSPFSTFEVDRKLGLGTGIKIASK